MKTIFTSAAFAMLIGGAATQAGATVAEPTIVSYTQTGVRASGAGGWSYNYDAATQTGTLNDGIVPSGPSNNELLITSDNPVITFKLDGLYNLTSVNILNAVQATQPGSITSLDITIGGVTQSVTPTNFGPNNAFYVPENQSFALGTSLSSLATDTFTISNFKMQSYTGGQAALGEVTVNGTAATVAAVPEAASWAMFIGGFGMVGAAARRRRSVIRFA